MSAAAADSIDYNAAAWAKDFQTWFADYTQTPVFSIKVAQRPATGTYKLQFDVQHTCRDIEYSHVYESMRSEFSPYARAITADGTKMSFGVLPVQPEAAPRFQQMFAQSRALLQRDATSKKTKRAAYAFLFFFLLNVALAALLLHNHWHYYDEPWRGVLEFFIYHGQLWYSSYAEHYHHHYSH
jgi:hypothetical protein